MSPDRHADRLYARLAGGAELTTDERRHVATCADCQRAVGDVARLDEQLRAATATLASEPIPDADLEPLDAPVSGWVAPLSAALAAGVVAIAVGFGLSQLRPPTGADATPTAVPSSLAPSPSPSVIPVPEPTPPTTPLASGIDACADGEAGFAISVPEGWYANLRQGDLMACSYVAPEPFDPHDADNDAPIRLTVAIDAIPSGTVVEEATDTPIGPGETFAERWVVSRDGEDWLIYVVALPAPIGAEPIFLHLNTRAADQAAADALAAIVERLAIYEPMVTDPDTAAAAATLFEDADVCSDLARGINVILPDPWWTNTAIEDLDACTYFAPDVFEIGEEGTVPNGVAITIELVTGHIATFDETIGAETLVVDGHRARRWELRPGIGNPPPDTRTYQYAVELAETPADEPPNLVATVIRERSDDYERDKAVLDEMMRRLIISPTPAFVRELEPLPSCGWELVQRTVEGDRHDVDARQCLWDAYEAGEPAELISTSYSVEGTTIRVIYRLVGPEEIEYIIDWSHDLGQRPWDLVRCTALERRADDELTGAVLFDPTLCDTPIQLDP